MTVCDDFCDGFENPPISRVLKTDLRAPERNLSRLYAINGGWHSSNPVYNSVPPAVGQHSQPVILKVPKTIRSIPGRPKGETAYCQWACKLRAMNLRSNIPNFPRKLPVVAKRYPSKFTALSAIKTGSWRSSMNSATSEALAEAQRTLWIGSLIGREGRL